jgi:hypothetical protein
MAQQVQVQLVDDLDGISAADETVSFALDGVTYEIDLSEKNAAQLREYLEEFIGPARRAGGRVKRGRATKPGAIPIAPARSKEQTQAIRQWARDTGHELANRGRIPADVIEAFEAAHAGRTRGKQLTRK